MSDTDTSKSQFRTLNLTFEQFDSHVVLTLAFLSPQQTENEKRLGPSKTVYTFQQGHSEWLTISPVSYVFKPGIVKCEFIFMNDAKINVSVPNFTHVVTALFIQGRFQISWRHCSLLIFY